MQSHVGTQARNLATQKVLTQTLPISWKKKELWEIFSEAVARKCSIKKLLLIILQNWQQNIRARVPFLKKIAGLAWNFTKEIIFYMLFSCEICKGINPKTAGGSIWPPSNCLSKKIFFFKLQNFCSETENLTSKIITWHAA